MENFSVPGLRDDAPPKPEDGGPAFPTDNEAQIGSHTWHFQGMSKRDWFAGLAMQSLIRIVANGQHDTDDDKEASIAGDAYRMADAMIAAGK